MHHMVEHFDNYGGEQCWSTPSAKGGARKMDGTVSEGIIDRRRTSFFSHAAADTHRSRAEAERIDAGGGRRVSLDGLAGDKRGMLLRDFDGSRPVSGQVGWLTERMACDRRTLFLQSKRNLSSDRCKTPPRVARLLVSSCACEVLHGIDAKNECAI